MPTVRFGHIDYQSPTPLGEMAAKSVASFNRIAGTIHHVTLEDALRLWTAQLFRKGHSRQTVKRYLQSLRTVYESLCTQQSPSSPFAEILSEVNSTDTVTAESPAPTPTARILATTTRRISDVQRLYLDAFLYMVYLRGMNAADLLKQRCTAIDTTGIPSQALNLSEAHRAPRRRSLFPFSKEETPANLLQKIDAVVNSILPRPAINVTDDTSATLWIEAALGCGIRCEDVRRCIDKLPASHSWMRFIKPSALSDNEIADITTTVADHINPDRAHWYAMKMRQGVTPSDINAAIRHAYSDTPVESTFYPCEEIARRTGHKLTYQGVPLIADILFFRIRQADITTLFSHIGHLAWCYRDGGKSGGPYSVIPDADMLRFQRNIGIFSTAYDFTPIGTHSIADGQRVRITGGPLAGYEGIVHKLVSTAPDNDPITPEGTKCAPIRVFQLAILGNLGIEWTASIDERLLEPLP